MSGFGTLYLYFIAKESGNCGYVEARLSVVRTVVRADKRYYYLVQTYRWAGRVERRERYLGTVRPTYLRGHRAALDQAVWEASWFPVF